MRLDAFGAIFVDVGNVLLYDFPTEMAFSYFLHRELCEAAPGFHATPSELIHATRAETPLARVSDVAMWHQSVATAWKAVLARWPALSIAIPGALDALASLGGRVAIIANQPAEARPVLESLPVVRHVERIFLDSELGVSKPSPDIYRIAAAALGVPPDRALMIGDRLDNDIRPAREAGLATAWIRGFPVDFGMPVSGVPDEWRAAYLSHRTALQEQLDAPHLEWAMREQAGATFASFADLVAAAGRRGSP